MSEALKFLLVISVAAAAFISNALYAKRARRTLLKKNWAKEAMLKNPDSALLEDISSYWQMKKERLPSEETVDSTTWNDLNMDDLYRQIDATVSVTGSECLYAALHHTGAGEETLRRRQDMADLFRTDETARFRVQTALQKISRAHFHGAHRYLFDASFQMPQNRWMFALLRTLLIVCALGGFFIPKLWIGAIVLMAVNAYLCYRLGPLWVKEETALRHIASVINAAQKIVRAENAGIAPETEKLKKLLIPLKPIERWTHLFFDNYASTVEQLLVAYMKMFFFLDVLAIGRVVKHLEKKSGLLVELIETIGEMDIALAVAQLKQRTGGCCTPVFHTERIVKAENLKHPLVKNCVGNTLTFKEHILLTGSNASGKSTFMKAVAVNAILAQTLGLCFADSFSMPRAQVLTSMAIRDDVQAGESYFIKELKSLRRMVEASSSAQRLSLCFIDEILRGTNTEERIAASSALLMHMADQPLLCMAATHDKELTQLLKARYHNLHFREEMEDGHIVFTFKLHEGPSTTRNAISLLKSMGFEEKLVREAQERAKRYDESGIWS